MLLRKKGNPVPSWFCTVFSLFLRFFSVFAGFIRFLSICLPKRLCYNTGEQIRSRTCESLKGCEIDASCLFGPVVLV